MKEKELILLIGPIGSGKTTFAKELLDDCSVRISQDDQGKKGHMNLFKEALKMGVSRLIVDRMNFNKAQREKYINPAREAGYVITIFEFKTCPLICTDRVVKRKDHPTIAEGDYKTAIEVRQLYNANYEPVTPNEYDNYNLVTNETNS